MFRFGQAHVVDEHGRSFGGRSRDPALLALGNAAVGLPAPSTPGCKAPPTPFTALQQSSRITFLILSLATPTKGRELGNQKEEEWSQQEAVFHQSQRRSWPRGSGDTTVTNEMVVMSPLPIEGTRSWSIVVSLMVCSLTAVLSSYGP